MWNKAAPRSGCLSLAACRAQPSEPHFPAAHRDVAPIVGDTFSTEDARDRLGEAEEVMELAGVEARHVGRRRRRGRGLLYRPAGAGRRAARAGCSPRTSCPNVRDQLSDRVQRERLDNVAVKLGTADNPMLPAGSFDRVFLVHMYHEVQSPYAFLWHLREGVKPDGLVDRRRFQPAGEAARHAAGPAQMRVRRARHATRQGRDAGERRGSI